MYGSAIYHAFLSKSFGVILAPTYRLLEDSTKKALFEKIPHELIENYNKIENKLGLINGEEVIFRSCEKTAAIDHLRNVEIGWFWNDEAALSPEYAWKVIIGRLRQKNSPLNGFLTTTPKGFTWLHKKFVVNPTKEYGTVFSTSHENIYLPKGYLTSLETEYTGIFKKQELYGEFVGFEGLVYDNFSRNIHVIDQQKVMLTDFVAGIDWGFTNPMAVVIIGFDSDRRSYIVEEFYERKIMIEDLINALKEFKKKYDIKICYCDPSEPQFIKKLRNEHLFVIEAKNDVIPGISEVHAHLQVEKDNKPRLYVMQHCINTIMEFENYRYPEKKENRPIQENPIKMFDHLLDSIRYVLFSQKQTVKAPFRIF